MADPTNDDPYRKLTSSSPPPPSSQWGTLEDLMLACAVHRYGATSWESIAAELHNRLSLSFTPRLCQLKFRDLIRRFSARFSGEFTGDDAVFFLDELRKLRVQELRRELLRYDRHIVSLQLKVKRLKERENLELERENEALKSEPGSGRGEPDRSSEPEASEREKRESVAESHVQSTRREKKSGNSSGEENQSVAVRVIGNGESQPLIEFMEVVRGNQSGSVFGGRFDWQESPRYRNLIRQHIELGMIQKRLESGQYSDCHTKFYRDLMLLVNNAIIFFDVKSLEHKAALEFRQLVYDRVQSHLHSHKSQRPKLSPPATPPPKPLKPEPSSAADHIADLKPKLAITGPVIACRKRSSIAGKSALTVEKKESDGEKPVTGENKASSLNAVTREQTRDQSIGSRGSSGKESSGNIGRSSPSPNPISAKGENPEVKVDKKKPRPSGSSNKVKRGSGSGDGLLLDLLKNAAEQKGINNKSAGNKGNKGKEPGSRSLSGGKTGKDKGKAEERGSPAGRSGGRLSKRAAAAAAVGKRGRDGGREAESLPKKRQRK